MSNGEMGSMGSTGRVVQLSSVNLNTSTSSVIEFLKENDRPIFFRVPENRNTWVIKRAGHNLKDYFMNVVKTLEGGYPTHHRDMTSTVKNDSNKIIDAKLVNEACYGCLEASKLPILLTQKCLVIDKLSVVMTFDTNGRLKLAEEIRLQPTSRIKPNSDDSMLSSSALKSDSCGEIFFTDKAVDSWAKDNSTLNDLVGIDVSLESIAVYESDIVTFLHSDLNSIPDDSPYFIPHELRNLSNLDQLAVFGFFQFETLSKSRIRPSGLSQKLQRQLNLKPTMAESAAFFINPKPRGNKGSHETVTPNDKFPDCQFPFLVEALRRSQKLGIGLANKVNSDATDFLLNCGFGTENIKYGEKMVRCSTKINKRE